MELTAAIIQKYSKYSTPQLRLKASALFRKFVRGRDKGERCICCGSWKTSDAGHFYSAGQYPCLELNEDNCHLCCKSCNRFQGGNLNEYRRHLILKIGEERVKALDNIAAQYKRTVYHHDRLNLIIKIEEFKNKK